MIDGGMIKFPDGTKPRDLNDFKAKRRKFKELKEAEKDEDGEEMEDESREERADVDKFEFEKGKEAGEEEKEGGLEAIAADLDGTESDLMGNLMNALKIAKGMDNEKLEVQIGNTLKFFIFHFFFRFFKLFFSLCNCSTICYLFSISSVSLH